MDTETTGVEKVDAPSLDGIRGNGRWFVALLFVVPICVMAYKISGFPGSDVLQNAVSLTGVSEEMQRRVNYILFVPLGAVIVVLFRVTLGIRVLGPFRSILLAIAFQVTGIILGIFFFAIVIGVIVAIRPLLRLLRLPYFGRVSTMLSAVAIVIVFALIIGQGIGWQQLHRVAYFPIVVICLAGDGFARTLHREGWRSAVWRGIMTVLVAVLITGTASIQGMQSALIHYPELVILEIGLIIVICRLLGFRLFGAINPPPQTQGRKPQRIKPTTRIHGPESGISGILP